MTDTTSFMLGNLHSIFLSNIFVFVGKNIDWRLPSMKLSSSYFKFVNNLKILVSAFNNLTSLFLSSSFNPSILFISSLAANLNFVVFTTIWFFKISTFKCSVL